MKPTVAFFANQFADLHGHGLARYARELRDALAAQGDVDVRPASAWSSLPPDRLAALRSDTGLTLLKSGRRGTSYGWTFAGLPRIEWMMEGPVDVTHSVCMGYPIATAKPLVVTVHDIGPLTHPEYFSHNRPWLMKRALDQAVHRADALVCISQATAEEVMSLYPGQSWDRLHVVASGVSDRFFAEPDDAALDGIPLPPDDVPFILTAGKISPRKNVQGVIAALRIAMQDIPHHLVVTGGSGWDMEQIEAILDDPILSKRLHVAGYVSDAALHALYRRAAIYVHPSLYEGFGLTVLEAMASGTPVVTSNLSSLPEVAGDAALLVDPMNPDEIAEAIVKVGSDATLAADLRARGLARAREFPWSATAARMSEIYEAVAR
ncbi:glycosyltransferase involved in cell wall biosynthesis [Maritimibacter alkaliphilus HTCC2654]|uniref:Hypothetical mannosyltransferase n=1 Tax=Maritimibacter alkaliphilus HTCC2654 TaxID=314271 RepID=A3VCG4_9RHOB|nr:glycosyltransferase family 1 protein [Maritimibacter alkaliphilus]EAQ13830.1 hypothetical mannosyltransferase [Maritimibacter alkaliphilus HTCC2654]TYP84027.1 glycosyltransferase involved in cell wall biosynthesis [Maritimibacter alkaliphilus HTCC2654]